MPNAITEYPKIQYWAWGLDASKPAAPTSRSVGYMAYDTQVIYVSNNDLAWVAMGGGTTAESPLDSYILDNFSGPNNINLTAQLPDSGGSNWIAVAGSVVTNGSGQAVASAATCDYVQDTIHDDVAISLRAKCATATSANAIGILFRMTDVVDKIHYMLAYFGGDGNGVLYKRDGGALTSIGTFTWSADASYHTFTVSAIGVNISIGVDNLVLLSYVSGSEPRGVYHGFRIFKDGSNADMVDTFQLSAPSAASFAAFPAPYNTVSYNEAFGSANGTRLNTFGWTELNGTWTCQSGKASQALSASPVQGYLATYDAATTDYAVEVTFTTPATGSLIPGLCFRVEDLNHFVECEVNNRPAYNGWSGFGVWYYDSGIGFFLPIVQRYFLPQLNTTYTMKIRLRGTIIMAELTGTGVALQMCGSFNRYGGATAVGLFDPQGGGINPSTFDNFVIRTA